MKNGIDLAREIIFEIEPKCNFNCTFCFNRFSFANQGRGRIEPLPIDYIKKIIDRAKAADIKIARFTGGEPLLRPDIFEILEYTKAADFDEIRLNANGSLINEQNSVNLVRLVDNFLIPIESSTDKEEEEITGVKNSLGLKIKAINLLASAGAKMIRVGTVITSRFIENFEEVANIIVKLPIISWELYRQILPEPHKQLTGNEVERLISKIIAFNKRSGYRQCVIANALPFCAIKNSVLLASLSYGAIFNDGYLRLVIDPRGFVKPDYYSDKNIGDPLDLMLCWNHPFMKKMRNLEFLPENCQGCLFAPHCRGGSRSIAEMIYGNWVAPDPMAKFENKIINKSND